MIHFIHKLLKLDRMKSRFFFWVVVIIFFTSLLYLVTYSAIDRTNRIKEAEERLQYGLINQSIILENWAENQIEDVRLLANFLVTKEENLEVMAKRFMFYHEFYDEINAIVYLNKDGDVLLDTGLSDNPIMADLSVNLADRDYFQAAKEGKELLYHLIEKESTGDEVVIFSLPVTTPEGDFSGVIFTAIYLEYINELLNETIHGETGKVMITDEHGLIVSHLTKSNDAAETNYIGTKVSSEVLEAIKENKHDFLKYTNDKGDQTFQAYKALFDGRFYLMNEISEQEVMEEHNRIFNTLLMITLIIVIIIPLIIFPFSKQLLEPLNSLVEAINRMKEGKYTTQLDYKEFHTSPKELRQVKYVFNEMAESIKENKQLLEYISNTDGLTGIANRRLFESKFADEWDITQAHNQPLSLLFIDIDYFKQYNDRFGHQQGDVCLVAVARTIHETVKGSNELVARYGGEEFVVILPNKNNDEALAIAQQVQQSIYELRIQRATKEAKYVTVSIGVGTAYPDKNNVKEKLIQLSDQALYEAKNSGRNRIVAKELKT